MGRFAAFLVGVMLSFVACAAAAQTAAPWLGVGFLPVGDELAEALGRQAGGELVGNVIVDSPAFRAGLRPQDLLLSIDGRPVDKDHSSTSYVKDALPGVQISLSLVREGQPLSVNVTLGSRPAVDPTQADVDNSYLQADGASAPGDSGRHVLAGATLLSLTPAIAEPLGLTPSSAGAVVLAVERGSSAEEAGLKKGDAIFGVGARRTPSALAVAEAYAREQSNGERPSLLFVVREKMRAFWVLRPRPLGLRKKWGPLYDLAGKSFADADGNNIYQYNWLKFGDNLNQFDFHPGQTSGHNIAWLTAADGSIEESGYAKGGDGKWAQSGDVYKATALNDTDVDYIRKGYHERIRFELADKALRVSKFDVKNDGTLKQTATIDLHQVDEAEIKRLAPIYAQRQAQIAQQQQVQQQAKQARGGGGGLFGALGGAMLGAMAGGNTSQVVGAAMKGAAIVDPNAAALGSVGDSLITGNTASVGGVGGLAQNSGGGSYPTRPNLLDGSPACSMMNQANYRQVGVSGGNDVQLKTMCAQAHEYYHMYLNAIAQGYSEADANRTYAAHQGAAQNAISFYENNR
jgi:hypothetical protein